MDELDQSEAAAILPHNQPVEVEALCLLSWDGDPETEGSEYYAPEGWQAEDGATVDAEGRSLVGLPSRFVTTRLAAGQLARAGAVRILDEPAAP